MADADICIGLKPEWDKGYFRKACAYEISEKYTEALEWYQQAVKCNPDNTEVLAKIRNLTRLVKAKTVGPAADKKVQIEARQ